MSEARPTAGTVACWINDLEYLHIYSTDIRIDSQPDRYVCGCLSDWTSRFIAGLHTAPFYYPMASTCKKAIAAEPTVVVFHTIYEHLLLQLWCSTVSTE